MKKAHISFVSFPHPPHVNPTLPIVEVLVRRGYRVSYATSDQFAKRVAQVGAEIVPAPRFVMAEPTHASAEEQAHQQPFSRFAVETLSSIRPFYDQDKPDLIVYDFVALAGRILANSLNIPAVQTSPVFAHDKEHLSEQVEHPSYRKHVLLRGQEIDGFLADQGIANGNFVFHRERLNIYLFPQVLQPAGDVFGPNCLYAGRCAGEQPYYGEWKMKNGGDRPICLVATSTTYVRDPQFFKMCIEALRDLGWHVILSIGDTGNAASLQPLPPHFEIVQHVSHIKILPHASLFICLGGIISQAEAMYHGVPLLVLSFGFLELEWQAGNTVDVGIGLHLKQAETNAENLRDYALRITRSEAILNRVKEVQHQVQREPGGEETANRLQELLG